MAILADTSAYFPAEEIPKLKAKTTELVDSFVSNIQVLPRTPPTFETYSIRMGRGPSSVRVHLPKGYPLSSTYFQTPL